MKKPTRKTDSGKRAKQIKWVFLILFTYTIFTLISCKEEEKQVLPNLYVNEEAGISFEYPDDYKRTSSEEGEIVNLFYKGQEYNRSQLPLIIASVMEKEGTPTFDNVVENYMEGMRGIPEASQFEISGQETIMLSKRTEAFRFEISWVFTLPQYDYRVELETSVIAAFNEKKEEWILLSVTKETEGGGISPEEISEILLSLKFLK